MEAVRHRQRTVCKVEPIDEVRIVLLAWLDDELARTMDLGDILDAGCGLGNLCAIVVNDRCSFGRMESLVISWREDGIPRVILQFVVDAEFFAEPDDSLGLGDLKVVDCERHVVLPCVGGLSE